MALADYVAAVLASSPRAYWKLDESSGLPQDSSGNGLHMTGSAGTITRGVVGPFADFLGYQFEGGAGVSRAAVSTQQDDFTFEAWLRPQVITNDDQTLLKNNTVSQGWDLVIDTNFRYQGLVQGVAFLPYGATTLAANKWAHVVVMRRAGAWLYFVNGSPDGTPGSSTPGGAPTVTGIGGSVSVQFRASHVAYYNVALSDADVLAHFSAALSPMAFFPSAASQQHVEALTLPSNTPARTSQQHVEAIVAVEPNARLSQQHVEVIELPTDQRARVSRQDVEVLVTPAPWRARVVIY